MLPWPYPDVPELTRRINERHGRMAQRSGRTQAKGFLDGIPRGVFVLGGLLASGVLSKGNGRKR